MSWSGDMRIQRINCDHAWRTKFIHPDDYHTTHDGNDMVIANVSQRRGMVCSQHTYINNIPSAGSPHIVLTDHDSPRGRLGKAFF